MGLTDCLDCMPPEDHVTHGIYYRGAMSKSRKHADWEKEYADGQNVTWNTFTSTTKTRELAQKFTNFQNGVVFEINVVNGYDISAYSLWRGEQEVLLPPGSRFVVLDEPVKTHAGYLLIRLKQC